MPRNKQEVDDILGGEVLDLTMDYTPEPSALSERLERVDSAEGKEYELAQNNLLDLLKDGADTLSHIKGLAGQTQHPRLYEIYAEMWKHMVQANREIMENKAIEAKVSQSKERDMKDVTPQQNIIMVGSTAELAQLLNKKKELAQ